MSDYLLNRMCGEPPYYSLSDAQRDVALLLAGLAACDDGQEPLPSLRSHCDLWLLPLTAESEGSASFGDVANSLYGTEAHDAAAYFDALARMSPPDRDFDEEAVERFLAIEPEGPVGGFETCYAAVELAPHDAVLSVISGSTLVSLPRDPIWMHDRLAFLALGEAHFLDHLSHPDHALAIQHRRADGVRSELTARSFWALKERAFPHLRFGTDVRRQMESFSALYFRLAMERLAGLDRRAASWAASGDARFPAGTPEITGESAQTMANYGADRRFHGYDGQVHTFEEHLWIDGQHRIHLIRHADSKIVEVGYIGRHLPTVKFVT